VVPETELVHGSLIAPMPGNIIDVRVKVGDDVAAGQTLIVIEAMKMEHIISAPISGTVTELFVTTGQQVDNGVVLLAIDSTDSQSSDD
jgi:propionyl-CoA carboxylase alpha chain